MDDFLPGRCVGRHAVTGNATCHGIIQRIPLPRQFHESVGGDTFRIFYHLKKVCVGLDSFFGRTKAMFRRTAARCQQGYGQQNHPCRV